MTVSLDELLRNWWGTPEEMLKLANDVFDTFAAFAQEPDPLTAHDAVLEEANGSLDEIENALAAILDGVDTTDDDHETVERLTTALQDLLDHVGARRRELQELPAPEITTMPPSADDITRLRQWITESVAKWS